MSETVDDPFKVRLAHARRFRVRRRVAEIDRHRNAIADRKLTVFRS